MAQTNNWTNAANANYSTSSAWSLGVPTSLQDVFHTNTATTISFNTNATVKSLTIGGNTGTALFNMNTAGQSLNVLGNLTLASGAGNGTFQLNASNLTVNLNGGAGSIINGGGAGTASLTISSVFSNSLGLLNASVDDLNLAQGGTITLIITNGQTYNVGNLLRLNNASTIANSTGTILMNSGTLNTSELRFNSNTNAANQAFIILNSNSLLSARTITRMNLGTDAAIHWNDGTIANYAGTNLTIQANAGIMNLFLSESTNNIFNASETNSITVASTALIQNKSGQSGNLIKTGTGSLLLAGTNTYTGTTTVNGGTLLVNGALASSNVVVSTGATLGGSGSLQTVTLNGGSVAPGNSPGLLYMNNLNASNGNFIFELGASTTRGVTYDAIDVANLLKLGSGTSWQFQINNGYAFQMNDSYDLFNFGTIDTTGFDISTFQAALPNLDTANSGLQWSVDTFTTDGVVSVIPEPSPLGLLILGGSMLYSLRRLRRNG